VDHLVERFRSPPWDTVVEPPAPKPAKSRSSSIPMTEPDVRRLSAVTAVYANVEESGTKRLEEMLGRVKRLTASEIPRSAVTMNSRVTVHEAGRDRDVSLVYPWDAGGDRISVLSRVGGALLGASVGSAIKTDGQPVRIVAIPYQPEAAGDHHL
jgi:hypothetical protein